MRFEDVTLESLDTNLGSGERDGNYVIPATDELIEVTNKIRERQGHTDLVGIDYENDVYYTFYLCFDGSTEEITLHASVSHGEKDDFVWYSIDLFPEEKEMLMWKVIDKLLAELLRM